MHELHLLMTAIHADVVAVVSRTLLLYVSHRTTVTSLLKMFNNTSTTHCDTAEYYHSMILPTILSDETAIDHSHSSQYTLFISECNTMLLYMEMFMVTNSATISR